MQENLCEYMNIYTITTAGLTWAVSSNLTGSNPIVILFQQSYIFCFRSQVFL